METLHVFETSVGGFCFRLETQSITACLSYVYVLRIYP